MVEVSYRDLLYLTGGVCFGTGVSFLYMKYVDNEKKLTERIMDLVKNLGASGYQNDALSLFEIYKRIQIETEF